MHLIVSWEDGSVDEYNCKALYLFEGSILNLTYMDGDRRLVPRANIPLQYIDESEFMILGGFRLGVNTYSFKKVVYND
jgi:hypothetical protein